MATVKNPWVGYLDRNFQKIKNRILTRMGETIPEVSDHSDSNILVIAIESFSGASEMIAYYIDNMAREAFITTARRYSSVVKHTRLIDYRIKAMIPAAADVTIFFISAGNPLPNPAEFIIPMGVIFTTNNGIEFITTSATTVTAGATSATVVVRQKTAIIGDNLGITSDAVDQVFTLGTQYVNDSVNLMVGGEPWIRQDTLGRSEPDDKHFIVDVSAQKEAYIRFGDNINGAIPLPGLSVITDYYITTGSLGNVEINTIINTDFDFTVYDIPQTNITNISKATGGADFESIQRIQRSAPLSLRTLLRAVTDQDYKDIALLAPGVDKAEMFFSCGKYVYLYIAPNGGGLATTGLLADVELYFKNKKMVTTFVKALPAGESGIRMKLTVTGRFRKDGIQLYNELKALLLDKYSYENSDVNKTIRTSDLIALVDNYKDVDYLSLDELYIKPYIRPVNHTSQLNYTITLNSGSIATQIWKLKYNGLNFILLKGNVQVSNMTIGVPFTDTGNVITLEIEPGTYTTGQEWEFRTLPINKDQVINDYSVPILREEDLELNIIEQLSI